MTQLLSQLAMRISGSCCNWTFSEYQNISFAWLYQILRTKNIQKDNFVPLLSYLVEKARYKIYQSVIYSDFCVVLWVYGVFVLWAAESDTKERFLLILRLLEKVENSAILRMNTTAALELFVTVNILIFLPLSIACLFLKSYCNF